VTTTARIICPVFYNLKHEEFRKLYDAAIAEGTKKSIDSGVFIALVFVRFHFKRGIGISRGNVSKESDVNVTNREYKEGFSPAYKRFFRSATESQKAKELAASMTGSWLVRIVSVWQLGGWTPVGQ
jgi:hypothetical protein